MRTTHQQQVLEHLKDGKTITQADAIHLFNCYRLSAVILQLRQLGYDIVTHKVRNTIGAPGVASAGWRYAQAKVRPNKLEASILAVPVML